jgi:hypothetical protein
MLRMTCLRPRPDSFGPSPIAMPTLVEITTSSRGTMRSRTSPMISSLRPWL